MLHSHSPLFVSCFPLSYSRLTLQHSHLCKQQPVIRKKHLSARLLDLSTRATKSTTVYTACSSSPFSNLTQLNLTSVCALHTPTAVLRSELSLAQQTGGTEAKRLFLPREQGKRREKRWTEANCTSLPPFTFQQKMYFYSPLLFTALLLLLKG